MEEQQNNQGYQRPSSQPSVGVPPTPIQPSSEQSQAQIQSRVSTAQVLQPEIVVPQQPLQVEPSRDQSQPVIIPPPQPSQPMPQTQDEYKYQSGDLQAAEGYQEQANEMKEPKPIGDSVSWSASEFVLHEKTSGWHLLVGIGSVVLAIAVYFLTKSLFGAVTIVIVGVMVSIFGNLKPRVLDYVVSPEGITIGEKHYEYILFRSFAVIDSPHPNLQLMPQKRFAVPITMYFTPDDEDRIVDVLGEYLPFEHQERDFVDKLSARLRF
ncbi:MAG: hypothetical protein WCP03_01945 [Candidatus Saccharibacteria bacterium]